MTSTAGEWSPARSRRSTVAPRWSERCPFGTARVFHPTRDHRRAPATEHGLSRRRLAAAVLLASCLPPNKIAGQPATIRPRLERVAEFDVGGGGHVQCLAFSGDGERLAGGGNEVVVWETRTWTALRRFAIVPGARGIALSPRGDHLATIGRRLRVHDVTTGRCLHDQAAPMGSMAAWAPDGRSLVAHLGGAEITVLDATTFARQRSLPLASVRQLVQLDFSADGAELHVVQWRDGLFAFDLATGTRREILGGNLSGGVCVADDRWAATHSERDAPPASECVPWSVKARGLVVAPAARQIAVSGRRVSWLTLAGHRIAELPAADAVAIHPRGTLLARTAAPGIEVVGVDGCVVRRLDDLRATPSDVAVTSDGRWVAALRSSLAGEAMGWTFAVEGGERLALDVAGTRAVAAVPPGADLLLATRTSVLLWSPAARAPARLVSSPRSAGPLLVSPDGRWLWNEPFAPRGEGGTVHDLVAGTSITIRTPEVSQPLAWSHDGKRLVLARTLRGVASSTIYLMVDGIERGRGQVANPVEAAAWSLDGRLVALASRAGTLVVDGTTLESVADGPPSAWVAFAGGSHAVTSTLDAVTVWHGVTGEEVVTAPLRPDFEHGPSPAEAASRGALSADGRVLAVTDLLGVHVFRLER